jgi:NitT/TauT family transport system substrate-binding protein
MRIRLVPVWAISVWAILGLGILLGGAGAAKAADRINFGLDWRAEAEYGGYYQALANGIYARYGLDVTIRQGGPQVNQAQALLAGRLDLDLASNSYLALNLVQQQIPFRAVAAFFQKDPSVLIAHKEQGHDSFAQLKDVPIMIGADTRAGWWNYLRMRFGYNDRQIRPYNYSLAPFLANKSAVQQGYLGSEPFLIEQQTGEVPQVLLLADAGFSGYGSLLVASDQMIAARPDLITRFLAASREGWVEYLNGDPTPGNELIKQANPEMTDALLAYGRRVLKSHQIVEPAQGMSGMSGMSGDIGLMTQARWKDFFITMQLAGLYPASLDYTQAYTLKFVAAP